MKSINLILFFFILIVKINHIGSQKKNINYKCGVDNYFYNDMIGIDPKSIDPNSLLYKRRTTKNTIASLIKFIGATMIRAYIQIQFSPLTAGIIAEHAFSNPSKG